MTVKMITFHVPEDREVLAAFGEVALRHEHMNHILKMTIKTLAGVTVDEALKATSYESSSQLRDRVRRLARKRLGEGAPLIRLQVILADCKRLTEERNEFVHGLWAQELDGNAHLRNPYGAIRALPTAPELRRLAQEIEQLTNSLNFERLEGFLRQALANKGPLHEPA